MLVLIKDVGLFFSIKPNNPAAAEAWILNRNSAADRFCLLRKAEADLPLPCPLITAVSTQSPIPCFLRARVRHQSGPPASEATNSPLQSELIPSTF